MLRIFFAFSLLVCTASAQTPRQVLDSWLKASQSGDSEKAWALEAKNLKLPQNLQDEERKLAKTNFGRSAGELALEILAEKAEGNCAVFVVSQPMEEGQTGMDLDPIYLIQQEGGWKILANPGQMQGLMQEKAGPFGKLEAWFKGFKQGAFWQKNLSKAAEK
jgi:hypothetical protein